MSETQPALETGPDFFELPVNNSTEAIKANVRVNSRRTLPFLETHAVKDKPCIIVGGGPSLDDYMPILRSFLPDCDVLAINGAYPYLRRHGIDPDYFLMIDSRRENVCHIEIPCETTTHYLATQVHPHVIDELYGYPTTLFNIGTEATIEALREAGWKDPIPFLAAPLGMASIHAVYLAAALGYRQAFLFGYDMSRKANKGYAYTQLMNELDEYFTVQINGKSFDTTLAMARTAEQFRKALAPLIERMGMDIRLCADGLLSEVIAVADANIPVEEKERQKYEAMWDIPSYRNVAPALRYVSGAIDLLKAEQGARINDLGCGTGRSTKWFMDHGFEATGIDIANNCVEETIHFVCQPLWEPLPECDYSFSSDVLEHIPPEKVDDVLTAIYDSTLGGCYLNIDTIPDAFGFAIGQSLHMTVEPAEWWKEKLEKLWPSVEKIDTDEDDRQAVFICRR